MSERRIILLGPPGAGKGTQAHQLCSALNLVHLATGDRLREAIARGTPVGLLARPYMERGDLVPDKVVIDLLIESIDQLKVNSGTAGYVLDGFPRTAPQAKALAEVLAKRNEKIDKVILIETDEQVIEHRLEQRRSCPDPLCGAVYNLESKPPKISGTCDICGKTLIIRDDDKPETIRVRQQKYWTETEPLIQFYADQNVLEVVSGNGTMDDVGVAVLKAANAPPRTSVRWKAHSMGPSSGQYPAQGQGPSPANSPGSSKK